MTAPRLGKRLTKREREIIGALCEGEKPCEMAKRLWLSPRTVEHHLRSARIKLGARTSAQMVYQYVTRYRGGP